MNAADAVPAPYRQSVLRHSRLLPLDQESRKTMIQHMPSTEAKCWIAEGWATGLDPDSVALQMALTMNLTLVPKENL